MSSAAHAHAGCIDIDWQNMDASQLERWAICFFEKMQTLPDAEVEFWPIKIEQEWRGIPEKRNPNFSFVQFEVEPKPEKGKAMQVTGLAIRLSRPFTISLTELRSKFGKYEKMPKFPHYNSPIPYAFMLKKYGKSQLILDSNCQSEGDTLIVEQIIVRRFSN